MEGSLKAAEVVLPPDVTDPSLVQQEDTPGPCGPSGPAACASFDPMEEFRTRLEEIVSSYSKTPNLLEQQSWFDVETDKKKEQEDNRVTVETEMSLIMQSLLQLRSPEDKLKELVKKYAEMASLRRSDDQKMSVLQQKFSRLLDERQQLQKEQRSNITVRTKLENLCRELCMQHTTLREETLERCREDEQKRNEMTSHFQTMLTEIQDQIEQHNTRNDKLCRENNNLTEKLESLMGQCELREESLEKINKHRDLQQKLTEARLAQANALLVEAEEKHKREKEYLLVQAAEWKLQTHTLREQGTVMQTQLALYAQKFDEFQGTLAKSNEIFHRFKKEMDTMSEKMKKMEKESNLWKTRFENCNKALTDMLEERTEKGKEYDIFVLKIQKLEMLCRALQDERKILYDKIKDVRRSNADLQAKFGLPPPDTSVVLSNDEIDLIQKEDPVLTNDMARLRDEQAKLQLFANSLFVIDDVEDEVGEIDLEEDTVASAFSFFKTKKQPEEAKLEKNQEEKEVKVETPISEVQKVENKMAEHEMEQERQEPKLENAENGEKEAIVEQTEVVEEKLEASPVNEVKTEQEKVEISTIEEVKVTASDDTMATTTTEPEKVSVDEPKVENSEVKEVKAEVPMKDENKMAEVEQKPPREEATAKPVSENGIDSSKKQAPKKKKKRSNKNNAS